MQWNQLSDEEKKIKVDDAMKQYDIENEIPTDMGKEIDHDAFLKGVKSGNIGFKVSLEPYKYLYGVRKRIFSLLVVFYSVLPIVLISLKSFQMKNGWYLLGLLFLIIGVLTASKIPKEAKIGNSVGAVALVLMIILWVFNGFNSYPTFFIACFFFPYLFFRMAESVQHDYLLQILMERKDIFNSLLQNDHLMVIQKRIKV